MASPLVFLLVGYAASPEQSNLTAYELQVFMVCLAAVYVGGLVVSHFLRNSIMRQNLARGVDPITAFRAAHLVTLAFYESGAIYGLLVALMGGPKSYLLAMVGVCLLMMAKDFPSESRLK